MNVEMKKVTPEMASELLKNNHPNNRTISPSRVQYYVREMKNGRWHESNDMIVVSKDGYLLNGQHRLNAVVRYGKPVDMCVAYGAEKDTIYAMDVGMLRSNRQIAKMVENDGSNLQSSTVVALVTMMIRLNYVSYNGRVSFEQVQENYRKYQEIYDYCIDYLLTKAVGNRKQTSKGIPTAVAAAVVLAYASGENVDDLNLFCKCFRSSDYFGLTRNRLNAIVKLQNEWKTDGVGSSNLDRARFCAKAQQAIWKFTHDKSSVPRKILCGAIDSIYDEKKFA